LTTTPLDAFLLTRNWRDATHGLEYEFWAASEQGPIRIIVKNQEAVTFVERTTPTDEGRRAQVELQTLTDRPVDALYFSKQRDLNAARERLQTRGSLLHESDIKPADRFLMERFVTGPLSVSGQGARKAGFIEFTNPTLRPSDARPNLKVASVDIETEGLTGQLYSIAVAAAESDTVFMVGRGQDTNLITYLPDERAVVQAFVSHVQQLDPDLLVGWNVVGFDLQYLARLCARLNVPFALGRDNGIAEMVPLRGRGQSLMARVPGRVVLDGIDTLKMAMYNFESFSLEAVSQEMLGKGKLISHGDRVEEINRQFQEAPEQLAKYNIADCRLVLEIFDKAALVRFAMERATLTGLAMDRQGGSVAAFDFLYLPRLHRHGYVAPDLQRDGEVEKTAVPGGYVMDSQPGLHDNVLVLDFKSLYPSIIRTFHTDPLAMAAPGDDPIPGYEGATFSRDTYILPKMIETLWQARDQAKQQHNKPMSQAIKILMNSFYGVLGAAGCRFASPKLAGSITRRGQKIITESREFIEKQGYPVIYGDTDSLFVLLGEGYDAEKAVAVGRELASALNDWWREHLMTTLNIESFLEVEFETHYLRFLMPTTRGTEKGSKKRYAGLVSEPDGQLTVEFKGLESVRTDWTPLARTFQRELYRRIFLDEPYEEYVRQIADDLLAGRLDDQLVYRKRLRKPIGEYQKNVPPHVQAARKLEKPGPWISYVVTAAGPEPQGQLTSNPDYAHYLDRQLAPAADGLLHFLKTSFQSIIDQQMELF
jgi:DNA polymerase II